MTENEFLKQLYQTRDSIDASEGLQRFDQVFFAEMKNPIIQYGYNYFLGYFAVGRFTLGHTGIAFLKLALGVLGFIGGIAASVYGGISVEDDVGMALVLFANLISIPISIWILVDYFLMPAATRRYNIAKVEKFAEHIGGHTREFSHLNV